MAEGKLLRRYCVVEAAPKQSEVTQRLRGHPLNLGSAVKGQSGSQQRQALTAGCLCLCAPWEQAEQPKTSHSCLSAAASLALAQLLVQHGVCLVQSDTVSGAAGKLLA